MTQATCFCGCGRKAPLFPLRIRNWNKAGRDATECLSWGRAILGERLDPDWEAQGERLIAQLGLLIHEKQRGTLEFDRADIYRWFEYARHIEQVAVKYGLPPVIVGAETNDYDALKVGRWMRQSGLTDEQANAEFKRRLDAGEPMPWDEQTKLDTLG